MPVLTEAVMTLSDDLQAQLSICLPSPLQTFEPDWPGASRVSISVKRDDLIHPVISGNKWRKLKGALSPLPRKVISFGGGYSNHIHALGYVCKQLDIPFHAIIRGHYPVFTPMLTDIQRWGAYIEFVDKATYRQRSDDTYLNHLRQRFPEATIIPEGGTQQSALSGVAEVVEELTEPFDILLAPVASGGTLAGLIRAVPDSRVIGVGVLKGEGYLESLVQEQLPCQSENWSILHQFHHGGYAKSSAQLKQFCSEFNQQFNFDIEPVYSGKLFWALRELLAAEFFPEGSRIVILHTGGLQAACV